MAADIYFTAQADAATVRQANELVRSADMILRAIQSVRAEIRMAERTGEFTGRMHDRWTSMCEGRNGIIREWQVLTGRQWETHGTNLTRA
jgi:hypothetical protein